MSVIEDRRLDLGRGACDAKGILAAQVAAFLDREHRPVLAGPGRDAERGQPGEQVFRGGGGGGPPPGPGSWQAQVLAKGWGYAILQTYAVQADNGAGLTRGIIGLCNKGQPRKVDDWGALKAWAWGASRALEILSSELQRAMQLCGALRMRIFASS